MKPKNYLALALAFFVLSTRAQPVINSEDFIGAGDIFDYSQASTDDLAAMDFQLDGGENLVWDFSEIQAEGPVFTESYFPLDSTPELFSLFFGNEFISGDNFSTHALGVNALDVELPLPLQIENAFQFYRNDGEGYFVTGNAAEVEGLPLISAYDTLDKVFSFPLNFEDADTGSFYFFTEVPGLGAFGQWGDRITSVDAWGNLTTPYGSFECLRVRTELAITDTFFIDFTQSGQIINRPLQVNYTWISAEAGGVVAEAIFLNDAVSIFRYVTDQGVLSSPQKENTAFSIFPNPAANEVNISVQEGETLTIVIVDLTGREVLRTKVRGAKRIDTSLLREGLYLVAPAGGGLPQRLVVKH